MIGPHSYAYVLLLVAIMAAAVRFTRNFRSAEIQSLRLSEPHVRSTQKLLTFAVLGRAMALTALSFLHMSWLWIAAVVAWLSGLQSALALVFGAPQQLILMERIFGGLFAVVAALVYVMFVR